MVFSLSLEFIPTSDAKTLMTPSTVEHIKAKWQLSLSWGYTLGVIATLPITNAKITVKYAYT